MIKYKHIIIFLLAVTCFIGCRPRGILSSREMRTVLVDLHKTDALLQVSGLQHGHDDAEDTYYAIVLEKHGITQAQFDSSLVWYTNHPQLFDKIYPKVLDELSLESEAFDALHEEELGHHDTAAEDDIRSWTPQEIEYHIDSLLWTMQHGAPVQGWINSWKRPLQIPYP